MKKAINLEETPFIDLRNNKNQTNYTIDSPFSFQNLPSQNDDIEYKIYKNFL